MVMPAEVAKQKEAQSLENVLKEGQASEEQTEVSEEETKGEREEAEEKKPEGGEKPDDFQSKLDAAVDKRIHQYQEKREADSVLIQSLLSQNKELRAKGVTREGNKRIEAILACD